MIESFGLSDERMVIGEEGVREEYTRSVTPESFRSGEEGWVEAVG